MVTTAGDQQHKHRPQHPGKHPVAQPGHQQRHKDPQAPSKPRGNDPRAPKKDKSLWGEQPPFTPRDAETKKSQVHLPKPQPHHKVPRERPCSTALPIPDSHHHPQIPHPGAPDKLQHCLLLLVRNWEA